MEKKIEMSENRIISKKEFETGVLNILKDTSVSVTENILNIDMASSIEYQKGIRKKAEVQFMELREGKKPGPKPKHASKRAVKRTYSFTL